jgi:putative endopeptidase
MFINRKILNWSLLFIINTSTPMIYAEEPAKTSVIPDKREYPVNNNINPCVNFYEYACSPVINSFALREDRSHHDFAFNDASERLLEFKKKYFLNLAQKKPETPMEGEVKNYYLACMNQPGRQKEEQDFVNQTKELLNKITTREKFIDMIAKNITSSSQLSFLSFDTAPNLDRPTYNDLLFDTHLMSLPEKSYYENKQLAKDLKALIEDFFVTIGEKSPKQKAAWVFNFEKELAQNYPTPPQAQERFFSRTEISRKKLIKNYAYLQLKDFLSTIPKHVVIRNIIGNRTMEFLNRKLKTATLEELKSIFLYFQLTPIMDDAYPEFFAKRFEFNRKYLGGPNKRRERQERCTISVMHGFNKEVDFILLPKIFPKFPKEKFRKSIEKIRTSLIDQLKNNTWLEPNTKQEAIRKITKAKLALVSPDSEEDWDFNPFTTYSTDAPIANSHKLGKLLIDKKIKELTGPINTNRWDMGPLTVNAGYDPFYNKITFPIGILQYPFYDPNEPEEISLGAIGAVIGHELGHGIDNHGNTFNADGVLKTWMSNKDKKIFKKRSKYLIKQLNKIGHNGEFTLGENIGDLVGISTAYHAAFPEKNNNDQDLKKRFFLQWARQWCTVERSGITEQRLKIDPHALGYARVNEQMKHQIGFKEAYSCQPTDPLVIPENEVVKIW